MELDANGLEVLTREQSLALLAGMTVGRVGLSMNALPVVLPVNFALDGDQLLLCTAAGSKLDAALAGAVVAFEVDEVDPENGVAWSVLVRGACRVVDGSVDAAVRERVAQSGWVVHDHDRWLSISTDLVSGRRAIPSTHRHDGGWSDGDRMRPSRTIGRGGAPAS